MAVPDSPPHMYSQPQCSRQLMLLSPQHHPPEDMPIRTLSPTSNNFWFWLFTFPAAAAEAAPLLTVKLAKVDGNGDGDGDDAEDDGVIVDADGQLVLFGFLGV